MYILKISDYKQQFERTEKENKLEKTSLLSNII